MDDLFTELEIPRQRGFGSYLMQAVLIVITALMFVSGLLFLNIIFFLTGLVMIFVDRWLFRRFHVELEYSYVNGSLDIARIYSGESRKEVASYNLAEAEVFAPAGSDHLDGYKNLKVRDFTSGTEEDRKKAWVFAIKDAKAGDRVKVLISPNDQMIQDIRRRIPSRTFFS